MASIYIKIIYEGALMNLWSLTQKSGVECYIFIALLYVSILAFHPCCLKNIGNVLQIFLKQKSGRLKQLYHSCCRANKILIKRKNIIASTGNKEETIWPRSILIMDNSKKYIFLFIKLMKNDHSEFRVLSNI